MGVGIFFTPSAVARAVPDARWALGVWVLGGLASVFGALVLADLGARWPRAGGLYVFLREGWGGSPGSALSFLFGWLSLLVVQPGAMAVIALVMVDHVAYLAGPMPPLVRSVSAAALIATFAGANLLGLRVGGRIQVAVAASKVLALVALLAVGIGWGGRAAAPPAAAAPGGGWTSWVLFGLIPALFTYGGAYHGTFIAGSVKDAERAVPRGVMLGVALVLVAYLGVNAAYVSLLGHGGLAATEHPAADAVSLAFGASAARIVAVAIVLSAAGILNTVCLGFPFVIYAMANDGAFLARAGKLDPRTGRPAFAVALQGAMGCLAVLVGSSRIDVLLTGIAFADATFHAAIAIVHVRGRHRTAEGGPRFAPPFAAIAFLLIELAIGIGCLVRAPVESAYGATALAVGLVTWFAWRRRTRRTQ